MRSELSAIGHQRSANCVPSLTLGVLFACFCSVLAFRASAQIPQAPTLSASVNVVDVFATVRDQNGQIRHDLKESDFVLEADGIPQTIRYFSQQTNQPLAIGLLVDTSASMLQVLDVEREASKKFFKQVLRPDEDQAFVAHFDHRPELLADLTTSRRKLSGSLNELNSQTWFQKQMAKRNTLTARERRTSTALYDAIVFACERYPKHTSNRKAIILFSDGIDAGSSASLSDAIKAAQRAGAMVYSIHIYSRVPETSVPLLEAREQAARMQGRQILQIVSRETGGGFFEVSSAKTVQQVYREIEDELRNQYSLGFTPVGPGLSPGFHNISIYLKQRELAVQARRGYYIGPTN